MTTAVKIYNEGPGHVVYKHKDAHNGHVHSEFVVEPNTTSIVIHIHKGTVLEIVEEDIETKDEE